MSILARRAEGTSRGVPKITSRSRVCRTQCSVHMFTRALRALNERYVCTGVRGGRRPRERRRVLAGLQRPTHVDKQRRDSKDIQLQELDFDRRRSPEVSMMVHTR
jgi:hypothetical protein